MLHMDLRLMAQVVYQSQGWTLQQGKKEFLELIIKLIRSSFNYRAHGNEHNGKINNNVWRKGLILITRWLTKNHSSWVMTV